MKVIDRLNCQLNTEFRKDAEDCLAIYNKLKELSEDGWIGEREWNVLVAVKWVDGHIMYKPSEIGKIFLKGMNQ